MTQNACLKEILEKAKDILIEEDDDKVLFIFINSKKGKNRVTKYTYKRLKKCVKSNLIDIYKIYNFKVCGKAFVFWEIEAKVNDGKEIISLDTKITKLDIGIKYKTPKKVAGDIMEEN